MINRIYSLAAFLLIYLTLASAVNADQQGVFVVDVQKILSNSIAGKAARSNLEAEVKKSESRLAAQRQEVERMKEDLAKQQAVLSREALDKKAEALKKKQRELELGAGDEQDKLRRKNGEEIEKVLVQIRQILADLSSDTDYPVIIEKDPRLVVYVSAAYDLTDKVITALDKKKLE